MIAQWAIPQPTQSGNLCHSEKGGGDCKEIVLNLSGVGDIANFFCREGWGGSFLGQPNVLLVSTVEPNSCSTMEYC